jgi:hypothetical protein
VKNLTCRNRDPRFPDRIRTVHQQGHVAGDPESRGSGNRSFAQTRELVHVGIAIRDFPTVIRTSIVVEDTWQVFLRSQGSNWST